MNSSVARLLLVAVLFTLACSQMIPGEGDICGRYTQNDLERVHSNGLPIWYRDIFDGCAVGSADWSTAGGKEEGEQAAWAVAVRKIVQNFAPQNVTVFEVLTHEKTIVGRRSSRRAHIETVMTSTTPTTGVQVRTVAKRYAGYKVYVLVERVL